MNDIIPNKALAITDKISKSSKNLAIATRIHLGKSSQPPEQSKLNRTVTSFITFCSQLQSSTKSKLSVAIAVDSEEKIKGYDLSKAIEEAIDFGQQQQQQQQQQDRIHIDIVKVSPWGNFIPALNALVSWAANVTLEDTDSSSDSPLLLFVSAETHMTTSSVHSLCGHMDSSTLVAGARLQGHMHAHVHDNDQTTLGEKKRNDEYVKVELNGRTTPWNTAAVWNLRKLSLIGFPLVAEGIIPNNDGRSVFFLFDF